MKLCGSQGSTLKHHEYAILTKTTETAERVDSFNVQVLKHIKEIMACRYCGHVVNPWETTKP
jgi:hypothetical protein